MALYAPREQLQSAWHGLIQEWRNATRVWDDPVRWQFEGEFYKPLQRDVSVTIMAMERLGSVLAEAEQAVH